MAKKENITSRLSKKELFLLDRYARAHSLTQTQVYEKACEAFLAYYETHGDVPDGMIYDSVHSGEAYRGAVSSQTKASFVAIAKARHKAYTDVFYSALRYFLVQQDPGEYVLLTSFLPTALYERCEKEIEEQQIDRATLVEQACTELFTWYRSAQRPKTWSIAQGDLKGHIYETFVREEVMKQVMEVARAQHCSPMDVSGYALRHRFEEPRGDQDLVVSVLLESYEKDLGRYARAKGMTYSDVMQQACEGLLSWLESSPPEEGWVPPPQLSGVPVRGYVSEEVARRVEALPYIQLDTVSLGLMHFIHTHDIHSVAMFIDQEMAERQLDQTPGISMVKLLPEQDKLIRLLTASLGLKKTNEFCDRAIRWWLTQHDQHEGDYPYMGRLSAKESDTELVDLNLVVDRQLHDRVSSIATQEQRSLRTIYYNVLVSYLDYMMEHGDDVINLSKLYNT